MATLVPPERSPGVALPVLSNVAPHAQVCSFWETEERVVGQDRGYTPNFHMA